MSFQERSSFFEDSLALSSSSSSSSSVGSSFLFFFEKERLEILKTSFKSKAETSVCRPILDFVSPSTNEEFSGLFTWILDENLLCWEAICLEWRMRCPILRERTLIMIKYFT